MRFRRSVRASASANRFTGGGCRSARRASAASGSRACLTSTQLSTYFVGAAEVEDIRKAYEAKNPNPNLLALHDQMLSYGTPAPKYVKRMMGL